MNDMTTNEVKSLNRLLKVAAALILTMATAGLSLMGWMALSINSLNVGVASIRTELDLVKPADILNALQSLETTRLRREDVQQIVSESAPWVRERDEWMGWRHEVDQRVRQNELRINRQHPAPPPETL